MHPTAIHWSQRLSVALQVEYQHLLEYCKNHWFTGWSHIPRFLQEFYESWDFGRNYCCRFSRIFRIGRFRRSWEQVRHWKTTTTNWAAGSGSLQASPNASFAKYMFTCILWSQHQLMDNNKLHSQNLHLREAHRSTFGAILGVLMHLFTIKLRW